MGWLLIKNPLAIVTMDDNRSILRDADILIEDNVIRHVGTIPAGTVQTLGSAKVLNASGMIAIPGLINTHHHLYQTLTRCVPEVERANLFAWLQHLYHLWLKITPEWVETSTLLGTAELLLTGCTTTVDHLYVFPKVGSQYLIDHEIAAARKIWIRLHACRGSMSRGRSRGGLPPDELVQSEDEILEDSERLIDAYHDPSKFSMCMIALGPCSPFSVTPDLLKESIALARDRGVTCHTHVAETLDEEKYCLETVGMRPIEYMESVGWLGPDVWFAHCVHVKENEIDLLAKSGTGVAHCPTSNMRLGSGAAPVLAMLRAGVKVGLAVDGSSSNDSSDMLGELRQCMLLQRLQHGASALSSMDTLWMATRGGAMVLGREDIGCIVPGKAADIALFNLEKVDYAGAHDEVSALVTCGSSHRAHTVIVNGKIVVENGILLTVPEDEIVSRARRQRQSI